MARAIALYSALDPGAWRIKFGTILSPVQVKVAIVKDGWFAERSRCPEQTTNIQARLGKDRLLRIICYK
jgi:hypothetical protein